MAKGSRGGKRNASTNKPLTAQQIAENNALNTAKAYVQNTISSTQSSNDNIVKNAKIGDEISGRLIDTNMFYNNIPQSQWFVRDYDAKITKITDKAFLLNWNTGFGNVRSWFPKSAIGFKTSKGLLYNEALKLYASKLGVKGVTSKSLLKSKTLINKIKSAGYNVPSYDDLGLGR